MLVLPAVLVVLGIVDLTGSSAPHLTSKDIAFLVISVVLSVVLGAARGATIELYPQQGELWQRYRRSTCALWIALIAAKLILIGIASAAGASAGSGTSTLLLTLGVSLLAEAAIVAPRAASTGLPLAAGRRDSDGRRSGPSRPSAPTGVPAPAERTDWSQNVPSPVPADDDYRRHDHHHHDHDHHHLTTTTITLPPHRDTTVCRPVRFPGRTQCADRYGFPGPPKSGNFTYHIWNGPYRH
jgi:hypothetical protein